MASVRCRLVVITFVCSLDGNRLTKGFFGTVGKIVVALSLHYILLRISVIKGTF